MGHTPEVFGAKRIVSCVFVGMLARIVVVATVDATRHAPRFHNKHTHTLVRETKQRTIHRNAPWRIGGGGAALRDRPPFGRWSFLLVGVHTTHHQYHPAPNTSERPEQRAISRLWICGAYGRSRWVHFETGLDPLRE